MLKCLFSPKLAPPRPSWPHRKPPLRLGGSLLAGRSAANSYGLRQVLQPGERPCPLVPTVSFSLIFLAATCNCIYTTPTPNRPAPPGWGLGLCAGWGWVLRGSRLAGVKRDTRREARAQSMCCARGVRAFYVHDIHTADAFLHTPYAFLFPKYMTALTHSVRRGSLFHARTHTHNTGHRYEVGGHAR